MTTRIAAIVIDALSIGDLARFWTAALGATIYHESTEEVVVTLPLWDVALLFIPTDRPKTTKNRIHLDLASESAQHQAEIVERLIELGAKRIDIGQPPDAKHVVLADPEGNELCIIEPTNNFLSTCGRFGSITCDGTREVGYFWSAALGWPLVWDQDDETAIRAADLTGPMITWGGGPLNPKLGKNRLHVDIAPLAGIDQQAEVDRLVSLGATRIDIGQGDVDWVVMADPDDNEFCVLTPR